MKLLSVKPSTHPDKKYTATFCTCDGPTKCCDSERKKVNFGSKTSTTFIDDKNEDRKKAYIARHQVREDFNKPMTAGSLSFHLLWGKTTSLRENIKLFRKRFKI